MTVSAVILAAGCGERMAASENKIYLPIHGQPMLCHTIRAFDRHPDIREIVLVVRSQEIDKVRKLVQPLEDRSLLVPGGVTRRDSAFAGVQAASRDIVLIHDGARPFPSSDLISRVVNATRKRGAAIPVLPVTDLLRKLDSAGYAETSLDRDHPELVATQTPQGFHRELVLESLRSAPQGIRDDAAALLLAGKRVTTVPGESCNIKITHPADLKLAEAIAMQLGENLE